MPRRTESIVAGILMAFSVARAAPSYGVLPITNLDDALPMPTYEAASSMPSGPGPVLTEELVTTDLPTATEYDSSEASSTTGYGDLLANSSSASTTTSEKSTVTVIDRNGQMHELALQDSLSAASLQADMYIAMPRGVMVLPSSISTMGAKNSSAEGTTLPFSSVANSTVGSSDGYGDATMPSKPYSSEEDDVAAASGIVFKRRDRGRKL